MVARRRQRFGFCLLVCGWVGAAVAQQPQNPPSGLKGLLQKAKRSLTEDLHPASPSQPSQPQASRPQSQPAATASQPPGPAASIPDSDCCTPAAMQKYAKQASFLDIVGIRLGMTPKEAFAAVRAFDPMLKIAIAQGPLDIPGIPEAQYPKVPRFAVAYTGRSWVDVFSPATGSDRIFIVFTTPPNPPLVAKITREVQFPTGHPVFASTLLDALRKKYGHENAAGGNGLPEWIYGPDGKLLQRQLNRVSEWYCRFAEPSIMELYSDPRSLKAVDITWDQYGKASSYSPPVRYYPEAIPACIPFTFVTTERADLISSPQAQNSGVTVSIESAALLYAAYRSTQEWLQTKAEAAQQKEQQAVKQNAAPKL